MGFFDSALSIATGGISDLVQGDAPFSGAGTLVQSVLNPLSISIPGIVEGIKTGDYASALQYAVDPITEPGIDALARGSGDVINSVAPGLLDWASPLVTAVAGAVTLPQGGWGALPAYELMNKMQGGSATQGVIGGATIGAGLGANSLLSGSTTAASNALGDASPAYTDLANGVAYKPTFYEPITADPSLVGGLSTPSFTDTLLSKGGDIAKTLLKDIGKKALMSGLMSSVTEPLPEYQPYQMPFINTNYGQVPVSQKMQQYKQEPASLPMSNVEFSKMQLADRYNPSEYTKDYSKEDERKQKEEERKKLLQDYILSPKNYLGQYLS